MSLRNYLLGDCDVLGDGDDPGIDLGPSLPTTISVTEPQGTGHTVTPAGVIRLAPVEVTATHGPNPSPWSDEDDPKVARGETQNYFAPRPTTSSSAGVIIGAAVAGLLGWAALKNRSPRRRSPRRRRRRRG